LIPKIIVPEPGSPMNGKLGGPSLKMQWERKVSGK